MKPENHAIRQLEKQLEGATPEVAEATKRVIEALRMMLMPEREQEAHDFKKRYLDAEVKKLDEIVKSQKRS